MAEEQSKGDILSLQGQIIGLQIVNVALLTGLASIARALNVKPNDMQAVIRNQVRSVENQSKTTILRPDMFGSVAEYERVEAFMKATTGSFLEVVKKI